MKWIIQILFAFSAAFFAIGDTFAQITSSTADQVDSVGYKVTPVQHPLFVFYQVNRMVKNGRLTAGHPVPGNYNFEWRRYNPDISGYDPPFSTELGVASSTVTDLEEGGYRVRIWDGTATDTSMIAWVMLDDLVAEVDKTPEGKIKDVNRPCAFLVLKGFVTPDTFIYHDPLTGDPEMIAPDFRFKWTSDNDELRIPNDTVLLDPNITYLPPLEDTWYMLTATDDLGMVEVDSVLYESNQTKAGFNVEYYDKVNDTLDADLTGSWSADQGSLDAMLTVRFNNDSENGAVFEWVFLDTLGGIKQSETTYNVDDWVEFTYERADEYYEPYLVSKSEEGCIDTFRMEEPIFVVPSQLAIPNVFSPNGDGTNDYWVFKHQSIKSCRVTVVDRTGKVVYRRKIDDIYDWDGWDGNVKESGRRAPEGQYYFVVEASGYDGMDWKDPNIIETWRSNRDDNNQNTGTAQPPGGQQPEITGDNLFTGWLYLYRHRGTY